MCFKREKYLLYDLMHSSSRQANGVLEALLGPSAPLSTSSYSKSGVFLTLLDLTVTKSDWVYLVQDRRDGNFIFRETIKFTPGKNYTRANVVGSPDFQTVPAVLDVVDKADTFPFY